MNPCPCGYYGDTKKHCCCSAAQLQRYNSRISGSLLDRFDLHVEVAGPKGKHLVEQSSEESSAEVSARVRQARNKQQARQRKLNRDLKAEQLQANENIGSKELAWLGKAMDKLTLSPRAFHRVLKVARTIADMSDEPRIQKNHLQEALLYRPKPTTQSIPTS